jgi:hypothetical protein
MSETGRKCVKTQPVTARGKVRVLNVERSRRDLPRVNTEHKMYVKQGNASAKYTERTKYRVKCHTTFRNVFRRHITTFVNIQ